MLLSMVCDAIVFFPTVLDHYDKRDNANRLGKLFTCYY
ncbi:hypothetical protein GPLA_2119 [Paraglaciecola polaris LMG 21857]|uniref:Uncharacterized protein n=1 Tax=Paraglaciecola polaris LMG 21857 TaxID=1129793 RepID=K6YJY4_9ALTE|nr:hypothetical protein GPLA_2119 [Paraglaciecola polaris LMG 21857]